MDRLTKIIIKDATDRGLNRGLMTSEWKREHFAATIQAMRKDKSVGDRYSVRKAKNAQS